MIGFLAAIGDVLQVNSNFIEQLADITSAGESVAGITATRTYTVEFRHSTDNTTWTAWTTWNLANATAITYDPNDTNYFQHRFTRTGSDATGLLEVYAILIGLAIDPSAIRGHGMISQENLHGDTIALFIAIIQSWVWQVSGGDHYDVVYKPREWVYNTVKPTIYLHGLTQLDTEQQTIGTMQKNAQISVGIKPVVNKTSGYDQQLSRLLAMFDPFQYGKTEFDFTFKGVDFIAAKMGDVGLQISATSGMQEFEDQSTQSWYHEFTIGFSLNMYNFAHS